MDCLGKRRQYMRTATALPAANIQAIQTPCFVQITNPQGIATIRK
jgi:hypothetical protein